MTGALVARDDFPIMSREVHDGVRLVYLDSAATAQKPVQVIDAMRDHALLHNGGVNRGSHMLAGESTHAVDDARQKVAQFVGVDPTEISWTKNSTESLNAIAYTFLNETYEHRMSGTSSMFALHAGDNIVVTRAEHHANLIPWQQLAHRTGVELRWLDLDDAGCIDLSTSWVIDEHTRVVAFGHVSNVTGAIAPVAELVARAREHNAFVVLDACQSVPHMPVDFHELDVDFAVFSGHKMLGPTGIGVLYTKSAIGEQMPPFLTGGSMVEIVTMEKTTFAAPPARFEAGTQAVSQIVGLGRAVDYLQNIGMDNIVRHEQELTTYALDKLKDIPGIRILGPQLADGRVGVITFAVDGVHPHDVGQLLDARGVAIRVGHHCAQPIHQHFGVFSSSRVSFGPYNTSEDVDAFIDALADVRPYFGLEG
ncbi:SufS family cysteine desulfurase [Arcanobacterium phocisimile]|uniref:Cysteine desulfurase n=1 Tax=Arcanobacterium phocisimile TaxID=1302235 RepID=A0ABX7IHV0_9ACTO|nr:SufS family cysteine desulfurase [Arcanobacterium phocisimile]QRV01433.1 SufS family cysteine desulfurase [Arcanobacterium phocisimile]